MPKRAFSFLHGLATQVSPLTCESCVKEVVNDPIIGRYKRTWMEKFLAGETKMETFTREDEKKCSRCQAEHARRNRLWEAGRFSLESFCDVPAFYSFSIPKYVTMLVRAQHFAKAQNLQLTWCYA